MKKLLTIFAWMLSASLLISCKESITPTEIAPILTADSRVINVKQTLLSKSWQFNEIEIQAGENTQMVFSRPRHIGLNNTITNLSINFKIDGTMISQNEGEVFQKGTWKLINYDTQLVLAMENQPVETFEIETIDNSLIQYSSTLKKDKADADTWASTLSFLQAPDTVSEIKTIYKLSSI